MGETKQSETKRESNCRGSKRSSSQLSATTPVQIRVHGVQTDLTGGMMDRHDAAKIKEVEKLRALVGELATKLQTQGEGKAADTIADSLGLQTLMKTSAVKVFDRLYNDALERLERLKKLRSQYWSQDPSTVVSPTEWAQDVLLEALGHNSDHLGGRTQQQQKTTSASETMWRPPSPTLKKRYLTLVITEDPKSNSGNVESGWKYVSSRPVVEAVWQDDPRDTWKSSNKPWVSRDVVARTDFEEADPS